MLINHTPWLTCCWLTGQCYYTETLLTRFLQAYCSQSPTSFFIFFTAFWWTAFKILMSSNHPYIHSLSYRKAQGCFKMSEGGLTTRTYPLDAGSINKSGWRRPGNLAFGPIWWQWCLENQRLLDFGRWEKEGNGLNFCVMPTKVLGDKRG